MRSIHSRHRIIGKVFGALTVVDVDISTHPDVRRVKHSGTPRVWVSCKACGGVSLATRESLKKNTQRCSACSDFCWPMELAKLNRTITRDQIAQAMELMTPDERGRKLPAYLAAGVVGVSEKGLTLALSRANQQGFLGLKPE